MKASYLNNLTSSFFLWLDHEVLSRGEAFINYTGKLYATTDPNFNNNTSIYGSPFKQWVYDSSINGAIIPSGVYSNNTFIPRGQSGLAIHYNYGRVIFNNNVVQNNNLTARYSLKEFNIYYTDEREEKLLFEKSNTITPRVTTVTGTLNSIDLPYPCIFFKLKSNENKPFAFGGLDTTENLITCTVLAKDIFSLDSVTSILADSARKVFPVFESDMLPFNYLGDLKLGTSFNYTDLCSQNLNNLVYIDRVSVSKFDEFTNLFVNKKCMAAIVDFELKSIRKPRNY
ncbi:MAG: hypothetical protein RL736_61 [Pseudomonadota bacterium]|jgi:hypothetical protein